MPSNPTSNLDVSDEEKILRSYLLPETYLSFIERKKNSLTNFSSYSLPKKKEERTAPKHTG